MATPSRGNIIDDVDIYDVFANRIASVANAGITYGTNNYHFLDMTPELIANYGGTTSGLTQTSWSHNGDTIVASEIVDYMVTEATKYSRIRNVTVTRNVTATGTASPSSSSLSGNTHLTSTFGSGFTAPSSINISAGQIANATNLIAYVDSCKTEYVRLRNETLTASFSVCHNSCHMNCHSSRGRR